MFADRRSLTIGDEVIRTPLIVPSYSSRAAGQAVSDVISVTREFVGGPILVSAYDIQRHGIRQTQLDFATHVFLDSGGYEAGADADLSEVVSRMQEPEQWLLSEYREVLSNWNYEQPTAVVTYDSPQRRERFESQIARARREKEGYKMAAHIFLAKPEPSQIRPRRYYLNIDRLISHLDDIAEFDAIGMTEKELGDSLLVRLVNTAKLPRALIERGRTTPIHIFGSLDPIACPLFFMAGADIFDGLTWLRYGYNSGVAIYRQNILAAQALQSDMRDGELSAHIHVQNYHALGRLRDEMIRFYPNRDFGVFGAYGQYFQNVSQRLLAELGE